LRNRPEPGLNESHRRPIGALTGDMRKLLDKLHQAGVARDLTADLERRISALEAATGTHASNSLHVVEGTLSMLWADTCELRAKLVAGYRRSAHASAGSSMSTPRNLSGACVCSDWRSLARRRTRTPALQADADERRASA
jgi:hypothetical protein